MLNSRKENILKNWYVALLTLVVVITIADLGAAAPWKFAVFCDSRGEMMGMQGSDSGVRVAVLAPIAKAVVADGVDLVLFPGDEVNGSALCGSMATQLKKWQQTMAPIYAAHIPIYSFRGNHENQQQDPVKIWDDVFPDLPKNGPKGQEDLTYSVTHNNALFIGFDQYVGRSKTYNVGKYDSKINYGVVNPWVIQQIEQTKAPWVFVFGHEMAFITHHTDCMANAPAERDALWDALGAKGGCYFCGHDHMYVRRTAPDSAGHPVLEFILGCAGAPPYPLDHEQANAQYDRHVVPTDLFVNAARNKGKNENTHGEKHYFGYLLITVDGSKATGEWKAFTNFDEVHWTSPATPKFDTLDTFTLTATKE